MITWPCLSLIDAISRSCPAQRNGHDSCWPAAGQWSIGVFLWSGGRIRWNRERFGIEKDHCLDALCVGELVGVERPAARILVIRAHGRGSYQRTNAGFPEAL